MAVSNESVTCVGSSELYTCPGECDDKYIVVLSVDVDIGRDVSNKMVSLDP